MSFHEVAPRADGEEEMDHEEADHEFSTSGSTSAKVPEEKCAICGMPKVVAESKLHGNWPDEGAYYFRSQEIHIRDIEAQPTDCHLCKLVIEAIASWKASDLEEIKLPAVNAQMDTRWGSLWFSLSLFDASEHWRRSSITLDIFRMKGVDSPWNVCELTETSGDTSSLQAASVIKQWFHECRRYHKVCRDRNQSYPCPNRVLELADSRVILRMGADLRSPLQYACLSHCWGPRGPSLRLTSATSEALMSGVSIETLPKTFQDAIQVCLRVGIQYLWIDALCIFQDDIRDWEIAAASMADVYEAASITIAVTRSSNSEQGGFSRCRKDMMAMPIPDTGLFVRRRKPSFPKSYDDINGSLWPLLTRAWVFQERRLSPRVVHLAQQQLYWECGTTFYSEDGQESNFANYSPSDPTEAWRQAVEHYSRLDLTFEKDRLPAISALVKRMQPLRECDKYVAGMWTDSLLNDLGWSVQSELPKARPVTKLPTWSWIAVTHGVGFGPKMPLPLVQLIDASHKVTGPSHIGYTENASITVKGPFIIGTFSKYYWSAYEYVQRPFKLGPALESIIGKSGWEVQSVDFDYRTADPPISLGDELTFLLLHGYRADISGIVLRSIEQDVYERVGHIEFHAPADYAHHEQELRESLDSLPIKQFKIV